MKSLVTFRTFARALLIERLESAGARTRALSSSSADIQPRARNEDGFLLIEVLVSTMLVAVIVIGTMTGFDASNKLQSDSRNRSAADELAQQAEDQLRGEPITTLLQYEHTPLVRTVKGLNGTTFTITSTVAYESDSTSTASCNSTSGKADYLLSTSEVTWPSHGARPPVVEHGLISPPPGSTLLVSVTDQSSKALSGATATATGATTTTEETSTAGCATFALLPGEYTPDVNKAGYVTPNWFSESVLDPEYSSSSYLTAETTTKRAFKLGLAGTLAVKFETSSSATEGDVAVVHSTLMKPAYKTLGTIGTYTTGLTTAKTVYPGKYLIYAGSCESDLPGSPAPTEVEVPAGGTLTTTVKLPPLKIKVWSGTSSSKGSAVSGGVVKSKDVNCSAERVASTNSSGEISSHAALPYGSYKLCVSSSSLNRKWESSTFAVNSESGPTSTTWTNGGTSAGVATIYLGSGASGTSTGVC